MGGMWMTLTFLVLTLSLGSLSQSCGGDGGGEEKKPPPLPAHTNIVLLGATGDLAQKYLWNALFDLFGKKYDGEKQHFSIYACSRTDPKDGRNTLSRILLETIKCSDAACREVKTKFIGVTQYHQLKTEQHYKALGTKMNENTQSMYGLQDTEFSSETGRIVYLSIPPSAYVEAATWANKHLRPQYGRPFFRLILEKPFGRDEGSARKLAASLAKHYTDQELYRVDHYLGKTTVQYILPFRQLNRGAYDSIWNREHIERVEIVMKEKLDVKGRVQFYDEVGVVRDVMQNHLTELLALVAMETPADASGHIGKLLSSKVSALRDTYGFGTSRTLLGQYSTYLSEAVNELDDPDSVETKTPTFAAAMLNVDNTRWQGVPFVMVAGKKLDEKASYVRVVFKDAERKKFCVQGGCDETKTNSSKLNSPPQVVFWIGGSTFSQPMVLVSPSLPKPREKGGWRLNNEPLEFDEDNMFGEDIEKMHMLIPDEVEDAYCSLLRAVFDGQRHLFTSTDNLLNAWKIWTPILNQIQDAQPRVYIGEGVDPTWLNFEIMGDKKLRYLERDAFMDIPEKVDSMEGIGGVPKTFRDQTLVMKEFPEMLKILSGFIAATADEAIASRGVFHLALSGGRNTPHLLAYLASNFPAFPWTQTHIWQVDERCVDANDKRSNFKLIDQYLLRDVKVVPYGNIHKMPVQLYSGADELCQYEDGGSMLYESELKIVANSTLDFIVLGVGTDGHTASLFPGSWLLNDYDRFVFLTPVPSDKKAGEKDGEDDAGKKKEATKDDNNNNLNDANKNDPENNNSNNQDKEKNADGKNKNNKIAKKPTTTPAASTRRMTLTYPALNRARHVAMFVSGREKHEIVTKLSTAGDKPHTFPVTGVKADDVTWFIDRAAWFGK